MYNYSSTSTTSINSPSLAIKISKNRAASLLSPIFGRFPFGRKEKELAILGDRIITGISDDGKMEYQRSTEKRKPDFQAIKSTKSKTSLLRRISTPTPSNLRSPAVRHPFKINSHSEIYTTFSKSSPDLNQAEELYQPWPTPLNSSSVLESGLELEVEVEKTRLYGSIGIATQSSPDFSSQTQSYDQLEEEKMEDDNEEERSAYVSTNYFDSPPSEVSRSRPNHNHRRSISPPLSDTAIRISRSLTLAKLESTIPFPSRAPPPTPSRSPPPTRLVELSPQRRRTYIKSSDSSQGWNQEGIFNGINLGGKARPIRPRSASSQPILSRSGSQKSASVLLQQPLRISIAKSSQSESMDEDILESSQPGTLSSLSTDSALSNEINLKGRAVRARNGHTADPSHSNDLNWPSSPDAGSSVFTDYSFRGRQSLESTGPSIKDSYRVFDHAGHSSISFIDRVRERDRDKSWSELGRNKIYGDKKNSESAVDVLTVVEEDETAGGVQRARALSRHSQPGFKTILISTPHSVTPRSRIRHNSELTPSFSMDTGSPIARKHRLSAEPILRKVSLGRSLSTSHAVPNLSEREERGPLSSRLELPTTSNCSLPPSPDALRAPFQLRPKSQNHNRYSSEINSVTSKKEFEEGPNSRNSSSKEDDDSGNSSRTKLVLLDENRPTMTYQLGECIGKGQFGSVYRALNMNSGRVVAVKRIKVQGKTEDEVLQLSNEVDMLKNLAHPGVVKYEGLVRTEHFVNIILEYVENGSLQKTLKHFGELPEPLVASYVVKILEGLAYLHSKRVVHCDLKCANILSTKNGNIKLSDFGVSLNLNVAEKLNSEVDVNGTPNWMAPEVIQLKGASTASDIWSLGCTIVELITGRPPYSELTPMSAMFRIVEDVRPPIPSRVSPELANFLIKCFQKDPKDRPTAEELFDHDWLHKTWDRVKDLRPQDSIPFLRRISTEVRAGAAISIHSRMLPPNLDPLDSSSPTILSSPDTPVKKHSLVKITFSKAVECKLCHDYVKRQAVLCEECGLIAHTRCSEFAAACDRAQLLSPIVTPIPLLPPITANTFFTDLNPFRAKRIKTNLHISPTLDSEVSTSPHSPPLSKFNPRLQFSEVVTRNRSRSTASIPRLLERRSESTGSHDSFDGQRDSIKSISAKSFGLESIEEPFQSPSRATSKLQKRKSERVASEESCIIS